MKVLILTGTFGEGHHSAAVAVQQSLQKRMPEAEIMVVDIVRQLFPQASRVIYQGFNFLVNYCSRVYNMYCRITQEKESTTVSYNIFRKLSEYLRQQAPDMVIVTMPIIAQYVSRYKEEVDSSLPLYTYITDIEVREEWIADHTDMYFVGSREVANSLWMKGISYKRICVSGIPVKEAFLKRKHPYYRNGKVTYGKKVSSQKEVLIMGGGLGMIPGWEQLLEQLTQAKNVTVTVITGKNIKLYRQIAMQFPQVQVVGYTKEVDKYMAKADVIVTKSGGITTFEAIHSETPMCVITPFLSQEVENARFIERYNMGSVIWNKKQDYAQVVLTMLDKNEELQKMKHNMHWFKKNLSKVTPYDVFMEKYDRSISREEDQIYACK